MRGISPSDQASDDEDAECHDAGYKEVEDHAHLGGDELIKEV